MKKYCVIALTLLSCLLLAGGSMLFFAQAQVQATTAQQVVKLGDDAKTQVNTLINSINANQTILDVLQAQGLLGQLNGNVSQFNLGVANLTMAHEQLNAANYSEAASYSLQAMTNFRAAFTGIHQILLTAGLESENLVDAQSLADSVNRAQERVNYLRLLVPESDTTALQQLTQAEAFLNNASAQIEQGNISAAQANLNQANQQITNVYQNLKGYAASLNGTKIASYYQQLQNNANQSLSYGHEHNVSVTDVLNGLGYQNEAAFNAQLENKINLALGAGNFTQSMQYLQEASEMVRTMNQAIMAAAGNGNSGNGP